MTDPIYNNEKATELANLITIGAQQMVQQARALGLTWSLRIATLSTSSGGGLNGVFDGDSTPISMTNISGEDVRVGQRVYVMIVPPSGNFIIGFVGSARSPGLSTVGVGTPTGIIAQSSGGIEVAVPLASWAAEPVARLEGNQIARVVFNGATFINTATDSVFIVRLRRGSVSTAGTQLWSWRVDASSAATTVQSTSLIAYIKNTSGSSVTSALSLTVTNDAGAPLAGFYCDVNNPFILAIDAFGTTSDNPALTAVCFSI